ncbi:MAG TPA: hypothetical protein PK079_19840 [Leptospiraceae bacterium]|nr:hypothetical protein [Leptospiraceae bacterium]HMW08124.1 hypothetical protein [Leptospiraceae bacterium]HMX32976.1 hypothetical protein [Leptospiraceae bacterium]HMY33927.1 hypothetical protein [Leptospiraceae bacterium]HNA09299.1 hypothetical protein [Leptospiraceae bacterium]
MDITETRMVTLELPPEIKPGRHKLVIVIYEEPLDSEEILSPETDSFYKEEIDSRLLRMQKEPHPGYTWEESIQILENRFGKKIKT